MKEDQLLKEAREGNIKAFHTLFKEFYDPLKSYIYRLVADRNDAEDLTQDTFVKSFDKLETFKGNSSLKTWVFTIATRLVYDLQRDRSRWSPDVLDKAREHAVQHEYIRRRLAGAGQESRFDIMEHVDFCFTCISKTIPLEQQVVLMLKDIYDFKVKETAQIIDKSPGAVKHMLRYARQTMAKVFHNRCALINKEGACHQCSQLNGWFNPEQKAQEEVVKRQLNDSEQSEELLTIREALVRNINPLKCKGADLHEVFMQLHRKVEGEIDEISLGDKGDKNS